MRWWRYDESRKQWQLMQETPDGPEMVASVTNEVVSGIDMGEEGLRAILFDAHPEWPEFPSKKRRELILDQQRREKVTTETFQDKARRLVYEYIKARLEKTDTHVTFGQDEVYVVWWSKVLQNWKALISTTLPDGMYYEVTYNGDQFETYIDAYKKFDNTCIKDELVGAAWDIDAGLPTGHPGIKDRHYH